MSDKFEIRISKFETISNFQNSNLEFVSDFVFRASDLENNQERSS